MDLSLLVSALAVVFALKADNFETVAVLLESIFAFVMAALEVSVDFLTLVSIALVPFK